MYELLSKARRSGMLAIEGDIETPAESPIFQANPAFLNQQHICDFVCDTLRLAVSNNAEPFSVDQMLELDMEVRHHGATESAGALSAMADSIPGLGIVAAVLGVVITMSALGGPPDHRPQSRRRARRDIPGILLLWLHRARRLAHDKIAEEERDFLHVLRVLISPPSGRPADHRHRNGSPRHPLHERRPSLRRSRMPRRGRSACGRRRSRSRHYSLRNRMPQQPIIIKRKARIRASWRA